MTTETQPLTHGLKVWPEYFEAIDNGTKRFEVRKADRPFRVGDHLHLRELDPHTGEYTPRHTYVEITYILEGGQFGIEPGYVVMGIAPVE